MSTIIIVIIYIYIYLIYTYVSPPLLVHRVQLWEYNKWIIHSRGLLCRRGPQLGTVNDFDYSVHRHIDVDSSQNNNTSKEFPFAKQSFWYAC